jgi:predicted aspartyl protease
MEIKFKDGLIFTSIELSFRGSSKVIENVVIDTGAAETIISPDVVEGS